MKIGFTVFNFIIVTFLAVSCQKTKDDDSPYEFGFTIDGQQHRHEKKDTNGIIQGEFGFITADGIYHVTVYATDENGNFKILSMRNIRISAPLDGSPLPPGAKIESYKQIAGPQGSSNPVQPGPSTQIQKLPQTQVQPTQFTTKPPGAPYAFTTQSTIKPACGGCGYVTTAKPKPGEKFPFQTPAFQKPAEQGAASLGNPHQAPGLQGNSQQQLQNSQGNQGYSGSSGSQQGRFTPLQGNQGGVIESGGSLAPNQQFGQGGGSIATYPNQGNQEGGGGNGASGISGASQQFGQSGGAGAINSNQRSQPGSSLTVNQQSGQGGGAGATYPNQGGQPGLGFSNSLPINQQFSQGGGTGATYSNQGGQPGVGFSGGLTTNQQFGHGPSQGRNENVAPVLGANAGLVSGGRNFPGSNQPFNNPTQGGANYPSPGPQYVSGPAPSSFGSGQGALNGNQSPGQGPPNPAISSNLNPQSPLSQVTVSNGAIQVPGHPDIPIKDKFPGMTDGLPDGVGEKDIKNILYKFHYEVGFQGHYEKGLKNGAKIGGYFVNGRDGVSRIVTYVADENGYRPKVKFVRLGLDSPETPKEDTEKTFGLKSFEFVWYPVE